MTTVKQATSSHFEGTGRAERKCQVVSYPEALTSVWVMWGGRVEQVSGQREAVESLVNSWTRWENQNWLPLWWDAREQINVQKIIHYINQKHMTKQNSLSACSYAAMHRSMELVCAVSCTGIKIIIIILWIIPVTEQRLSYVGLNWEQFVLCPAGGGSQPQSRKKPHVQTAAAALTQQVPVPHRDQMSGANTKLHDTFVLLMFYFILQRIWTSQWNYETIDGKRQDRGFLQRTTVSCDVKCSPVFSLCVLGSF